MQLTKTDGEIVVALLFHPTGPFSSFLLDRALWPLSLISREPKIRATGIRRRRAQPLTVLLDVLNY